MRGFTEALIGTNTFTVLSDKRGDPVREVNPVRPTILWGQRATFPDSEGVAKSTGCVIGAGALCNLTPPFYVQNSGD